MFNSLSDPKCPAPPQVGVDQKSHYRSGPKNDGALALLIRDLWGQLPCDQGQVPHQFCSHCLGCQCLNGKLLSQHCSLPLGNRIPAGWAPFEFCPGQSGGLLFSQGPTDSSISTYPSTSGHRDSNEPLRWAEVGGLASYHPFSFHITKQLRISVHKLRHARNSLSSFSSNWSMCSTPQTRENWTSCYSCLPPAPKFLGLLITHPHQERASDIQSVMCVVWQLSALCSCRAGSLGQDGRSNAGTQTLKCPHWPLRTWTESGVNVPPAHRPHDPQACSQSKKIIAFPFHLSQSGTFCTTFSMNLKEGRKGCLQAVPGSSS